MQFFRILLDLESAISWLKFLSQRDHKITYVESINFRPETQNLKVVFLVTIFFLSFHWQSRETKYDVVYIQWRTTMLLVNRWHTFVAIRFTISSYKGLEKHAFDFKPQIPVHFFVVTSVRQSSNKPLKGLSKDFSYSVNYS